MIRLGQRCLAAAGGLMLDRLVGEPPSDVHPVAGFGRTMERAEHVLWADRRLNGAAYALTGAAMGAAAGLTTGSTAVVTWAVSAGRELRRAASRIGELAGSGDLAAARAELPSLVGRDPSELDASGIAAAVIESLAENSVDAVIAPAFWAAVAGAPGAAAYRAINTMDAMVGRRDDRYGNFGWAAARLDDVANYVPARIFAGLVVSAVPPPGPRDHRCGPAATLRPIRPPTPVWPRRRWRLRWVASWAARCATGTSRRIVPCWGTDRGPTPKMSPRRSASQTGPSGPQWGCCVSSGWWPA